MTVKIEVPELGESIVEATVGEWHKQEGDQVAIGDPLVELETDKVDIEVGAETAGILRAIHKTTGEDVKIGDTLGEIESGDEEPGKEEELAAAEEEEESALEKKQTPQAPDVKDAARATPVAQRLADDRQVDLAQIDGSGPSGRVTREDVEQHLRLKKEREAAREPEKIAAAKPRPVQETLEKTPAAEVKSAAGQRAEERVRMSRRRRTIASRLLQTQETTATLTTFNDADMSAIISLRKRRGESFLERHQVKLGYMSFFVKAAISALKAFPRLNAEIDGDEIVFKHYYDIGIAVGAEEGLIVPVVRDADRKSFAQIERDILDLAQKARDGALALEEIRGGTFTITNGGIFGSLLSTPILNAPQVGILGMHRIEERPVAVNGEIAIRPVMYLALSYDHRLIDGREAVQFLGHIKELIEDPESLLLEG